MTDDRGTLRWVPTTEFARLLAGVPDRHERAAGFATLSRINALYMIMRAGSGHLGSSFSAADVVAWVLLQVLRDGHDAARGDVYFSSKGHDVPGLYAALVGLGRLPETGLEQLRRLGGLPGHPDVGTPHMPFNTGSLGMGISKAKGLVLANRLRGLDRRVVVMTGDGELQEGQNWEALAGAAHAAMGELTVVVDANGLQSDTWVRDVSDLGDLAAKFAAFGWGVVRCDGNDAAHLDEAFAARASEHPDRPVVVVADTVKGAGCDVFAATSMPEEEWRYRYHSGAPPLADYDRGLTELLDRAQETFARHGLPPLVTVAAPHDPPPPSAGPRLPVVYGHALLERARRDERVVALDADLVLDTGLIPFAEALPDRFVECGIAEQDMVSMAGGLAAGGLLPFVHSFSCFLHARPNEQIYTNATEGRRVVYVGSLAGLVPAAPGHSHQAVRDVSAVGAVPGLVVLEPSTPQQAEAAVDYCLTTTDSVYLRLVSAPCPVELLDVPDAELVPGRGRVLRPGGRVVALAAGPVVLRELLHAADALAGDGIDLAVVDLPWHNRVDRAWLTGLAADVDHVVVVENHYTRGGQADVVARALAEADGPHRPRFLGVGLDAVPACGTPAEALAAHRLDAAHLAETVRTHVTGGTADAAARVPSATAGV